MQENEYQQYLVSRIYEIFEQFGARRLIDVIVNINDPNYIQGIPDLTVFYRPTARYAMLEVKLSAESKEQPNQRWYVETWGETAFTAFIHPENERPVLDALQQALRA